MKYLFSRYQDLTPAKQEGWEEFYPQVQSLSAEPPGSWVPWHTCSPWVQMVSVEPNHGPTSQDCLCWLWVAPEPCLKLGLTFTQPCFLPGPWAFLHFPCILCVALPANTAVFSLPRIYLVLRKAFGKNLVKVCYDSEGLKRLFCPCMSVADGKDSNWTWAFVIRSFSS